MEQVVESVRKSAGSAYRETVRRFTGAGTGRILRTGIGVTLRGTPLFTDAGTRCPLEPQQHLALARALPARRCRLRRVLDIEDGFHRQLQFTRRSEPQQFADHSRFIRARGDLENLARPETLDGRLLEDRIPRAEAHRLIGHRAERHQGAVFAKQTEDVTAGVAT